ncbi:MAG: hypothetical protein ACRCY3_01285 [Sphingorhabdus sp.]
MTTAPFYRERAEQAQRDANQATLENVRARHLLARDTWIEMANKSEKMVRERDRQDAEKLALRQANALAEPDANIGEPD